MSLESPNSRLTKYKGLRHLLETPILPLATPWVTSSKTQQLGNSVLLPPPPKTHLSWSVFEKLRDTLSMIGVYNPTSPSVSFPSRGDCLQRPVAKTKWRTQPPLSAQPASETITT